MGDESTGWPRDAQHPVDGEKRQPFHGEKALPELRTMFPMCEQRPSSSQLSHAMSSIGTTSPGQTKAGKAPNEAKRDDLAGQHIAEMSPQSSERETTPTHNKPNLVFYESNSEGEDDPMVSGTIIPMTARVEIQVPSSGVRGVFMALLDSRCTQCLISLRTVQKLQ